MFQTLTFSEAVSLNLIAAENVDPHDFAPYCQHDLYMPGVRGISDPLFSCEICDALSAFDGY